MIFRQYVVLEDGTFVPHHEHPVMEYPEGVENILSVIFDFFNDCGNEYFPAIEIEDVDKVSEKDKEVYQSMFAFKQIEYFLFRRWAIRLVNPSARKFDDLELGFSDLSVQKELEIVRKCILDTQRKFQVARITPRRLHVHFGELKNAEAFLPN